MVVSAAMNRTTGSAIVCDALLRRRESNSIQIERRIQNSIDAGELSAEANADDVARFYMALYQGMSCQARDGASYEDLVVTVQQGMRAWPPQTASRSDSEIVIA